MNLKRFQEYFSLRQEKIFNLILMSAFLGFYYLLFIIMRVGSQGIFEREEWLIFQWGWLIVPVAAILTALIIEKTREVYYGDVPLFYPSVLLINSLFFFIVIWVMRLYNPLHMCSSFACVVKMIDAQAFDFATARFLSTWIPVRYLLILCDFVFIINLVTLLFVKFLSQLVKTENLRDGVAQKIYFFIPLIIGFGLVNFSSFKTDYWMTWLMAMLFAGVVIFHERLVLFSPSPKWLALVNFFAVLLIVFVIVEPNFLYEKHHMNPYFGPVNDLICGKSILVDVPSLYGIFLIYFLKFMFAFIPMTYQGFNLLLTILFFIQYVMIYVLLRFLLKSPLYTVGTLFFMMVVNFLAHKDLEIVAYPSSGPLRFGLPVYLFFIMMLRARFSKAKGFCLLTEYLLVALSSVWSFETFIYVLAAYMAVICFESFTGSNNGKGFFIQLFKRCAVLAFFIFVAHVLLTWNIYLRSGEFPHWDRYFDGVMNYAHKGMASVPIDPWGPWVFMVLIPFLSLIMIVYLCLTKQEKNFFGLNIITAMTALSIPQFTYYVNRSHLANLYNISIPIVLISSYWLVHITKSSQRPIRWFRPTFLYGCYFVMFYFLLRLAPFVYQKLLIRWPQYSHIKENFTKSQLSVETPEALYLVHKYTPHDNRIALFLDQHANVETFILSKKAHILPYNFVTLGTISTITREIIFNSLDLIKEGDIIFVMRNNFDELQFNIINQLRSKFKFEILEATPHVYAIKLKKL